MAAETFTFNIAKGRVAELYNRVENNDPSTAALILVPFGTLGSEAEGQDADTLAAVEALATFAEITTGNWARKTLTDTELAAFPAPDDTNNRYDVSVPVIQWSPGPTAGNNAQGFIVCYDANTGAGTDTDLIPLTAHALTVNGDGNVVEINAGVFFRGT